MDECRKPTAYWLRSIGQSLCFLLVWGFINGNLGHISPELNQLLALLFLIVFSASLFPARSINLKNYNLKPLLLAGGALVAAALLWLSGGEVERCFAVTLLLFSTDLTLKAFGITESKLPVYLLAAILITLYVTLYKHIPAVWFIVQYASQFFSKAVTRLSGEPLLLGATASGLHILIYFFAYLLSLFLLTKRESSKRLALAFALAVVVNIVYLAIHSSVLVPLFGLFQNTYHQGHSHYRSYGLTSLNTGIFLVILLAVPLLLLEPAARKVKQSAASLWTRGLLASAGLVMLGAFAVTYTPATGNTGGTVYLYDSGLLNWEKPVFGRYGERAGGMFGLLPEFLEASGFGVKRGTALSADALSDVKTLVLINLQKEFSAEEHDIIWGFVNGGGSLLVLGDHTGLAGIRDPFNALLKPVGIEFNFDSAHYIKDWDYGFELLPHQTTWQVNPDRELGISVGASLNVPPSSRPVVIGKYGFSDTGNADNGNQAFLGDRRYNKGELLGDMVLASASDYGKGKVLVFGDTSPFQNGAIALSHKFVRRVFDWMASPQSFFYRHQILIGSVMLMAGLVLMLLKSGGSQTATQGLIFASLAGLFISAQAGSWSYGDKPLKGNIAYIDTSHLERIDYDLVSDRALMGLSYNLMRNGYLPIEMRQFSDETVKAGNLFVSVAPARPFSRSELKTLEQFMNAGGTFLLSAGWEEASGCRNVLSNFGLNLENIPLGPVEPEDNTAGIHFYSAWPVSADDPQATEVLCTLRDPAYPLIVKRGYGQGGLIFVADAGFLTNVNLETVRDYSPENIAFLKLMLQPEPATAAITLNKQAEK